MESKFQEKRSTKKERYKTSIKLVHSVRHIVTFGLIYVTVAFPLLIFFSLSRALLCCHIYIERDRDARGGCQSVRACGGLSVLHSLFSRSLLSPSRNTWRVRADVFLDLRTRYLVCLAQNRRIRSSYTYTDARVHAHALGPLLLVRSRRDKCSFPPLPPFYCFLLSPGDLRQGARAHHLHILYICVFLFFHPFSLFSFGKIIF